MYPLSFLIFLSCKEEINPNGTGNPSVGLSLYYTIVNFKLRKPYIIIRPLKANKTRYLMVNKYRRTWMNLRVTSALRSFEYFPRVSDLMKSNKICIMLIYLQGRFLLKLVSELLWKY